MPNDPLEKLRDLHLPDTISWWPLAAGWWIIILALLAGGAYLLYLYLQKRRRNVYRQLASTELQNAWKTSREQGDVQGYLQSCNSILRRTALHRAPAKRKIIAPLSGQAWFDYLDSCCAEPVFASNIEAALHDAHYRPVDDKETAKQVRQLHRAALSWLGTHS